MLNPDAVPFQYPQFTLKSYNLTPFHVFNPPYLSSYYPYDHFQFQSLNKWYYQLYPLMSPPGFGYCNYAYGQNLVVVPVKDDQSEQLTANNLKPPFNDCVNTGEEGYMKTKSVTVRQIHGKKKLSLGRLRCKAMWRAKEDVDDALRKKDSSFDISDLKDVSGGKTTVMIKNIPNKYSRKMLLQLLDDHCVEENKKAQLRSDEVVSEYDFLYLPIDFSHRCNLGYAFVNFTNTEATWRFRQAFKGHKWHVFDSKKCCDVTYARIQGQDALLSRFQNSNFKCDSDEFLPVLFSPARNGLSSLTPPLLIGNRSR